MSAANLSGSPDQLLSLTAAAKRLHINYRSLRKAVHSGDLPAYRTGGERCRVLWGEVTAWVRSQRVFSGDSAHQSAAGGPKHG